MLQLKYLSGENYIDKATVYLPHGFEYSLKISYVFVYLLKTP